MTRTLIVLLAAGLGLAPGARAEPSELERLRAENARLQSRVTELEADNAALRRRVEGSLAGALEQRAAEAVQVDVDSHDDVTTVATTPSLLQRSSRGGSRHWIALRGDRPSGSGAPSQEGVELVIETAASGNIYRTVRTLQLVADGTTYECPVIDYRTEPITVARSNADLGNREKVVTRVPLGTLARLGEAQDVRGTLGPTSFRLTPEQLATLRAFARRVQG